MMYTVLLGLGTNLGDRKANLTEAKRLLSELTGDISAESKLYQTAAWGITDQPDFYNQVVQLQTNMLPLRLMAEILAIELNMGRQRIIKWGERLIDIDILFFDNIVFTTPNLIIPHPLILERRFVVQPILDIQPKFAHPVYRKTIEELSKSIRDESDVIELQLN